MAGERHPKLQPHVGPPQRHRQLVVVEFANPVLLRLIVGVDRFDREGPAVAGKRAPDHRPGVGSVGPFDQKVFSLGAQVGEAVSIDDRGAGEAGHVEAVLKG